MGRDKDYSGSFKWGVTINIADIPIENAEYFEGKTDNLIDWLREYSPGRKGRSVYPWFPWPDAVQWRRSAEKSNVLSGGEKMRCMFSRMMLQQANVCCCLTNQPTTSTWNQSPRLTTA
jgi:ATPase subunit of ABC transporter with duplicated ATPase domains